MQHVYDETTGEYQYSYAFPPGCRPAPGLLATRVAPTLWRILHGEVKAFFHNGVWRYEDKTATGHSG